MPVFFPLKDISLRSILNNDNNYSQKIFLFYDKITEYYCKTEDYISAIQISYKFRDFDRIFQILEKSKGIFINKGNLYTIIKYFLETPMEVKCKYMYTTLNILYIIVLSGDYSLFDQFRNELFEYVVNSNMTINQKKKILGYMEFERVFYVYNNIDIMFNCYKKSLELLGENTFKKYDNMIDLISMTLPCFIYSFHNSIYNLDKIIYFVSDKIPIYYRLTNNNNLGLENILAAEWLYFKGKLVEARFMLQNALFTAEQYGKASVIISSLFLYTRISVLSGNYQKIVEYLQKMRNIANEYEYSIYSVAVDFCEAHIYGILGHNEFIKNWIINDIQFNNLKVNVTNCINYLITHTKCLINDHKYNEALLFIDFFVQEHKNINRIFMDIYAYMYRAIIFNAKGNHNLAIDNLKKSLELAIPDKIYMVFSENYSFLENLLSELYFDDKFYKDIDTIIDYGERFNWWIQRFEQENFYNNQSVV